MKRATHIAAIALIGMSGLAIAGPDGKKAESQDDTQLLKGPKVRQTVPADQRRERSNDSMADRQQRDQRGSARGEQMREMLGALRALSKAEGDLQTTEEQREQIKKISEAQREAMKAYMEEHKAEIDKIRAEAKANHVEGERPDPEARKAVMAKIQKIMEAGPNDGEARKKIMAVLSEGQQAHVKKTIEQRRKQMEARNARGKDGAQGRRGDRDPMAEDADRERRAPRDGAERKEREGKKAKRERPAPVDD